MRCSHCGGQHPRLPVSEAGEGPNVRGRLAPGCKTVHTHKHMRSLFFLWVSQFANAGGHPGTRGLGTSARDRCCGQVLSLEGQSVSVSETC